MKTDDLKQEGQCDIHDVSGSYFSNKFRIVTDRYNGYEVQIKRWWFPFWVECWKNGCVNSFSDINKAKTWIQNGRPMNRFKRNVVEVL